MAVFSATDFLNNEATVEKRQYDVGFFSVKPNSEAIVRIMCNNLNDIEILTTHPITVGASSFPNRQVNCLRTAHEPLDNCPLCKAGEKVRQRAFIKMIEYDPVTRESKAVVWDRAAKQIVPQLKNYLDNYGPLSNIMCKVVRTGSGIETKYDIVPNINPQVYNMTDFPLPAEDPFKEFKVLGRMVMDKNAEEIMQFMQTGEFPQRVQQEQPPQQQFVNAQSTTPVQMGYNNQPVYVESLNTSVMPGGPVDPDIPFSSAPVMGVSGHVIGESAGQVLNRPVRYE